MPESRVVILCGECKMWKNICKDFEGRRYGVCDLDGKKHYRIHKCKIMDKITDNVNEQVLLYDRAGMYAGQIAQRVQLSTDEVREILNKYKSK